MPKKKSTKKPATKKSTEDMNKVGFPNAKPASQENRDKKLWNEPIRCCGNVVKVKDGVAEEADPKVLRRRKMIANQKKGLQFDEERL